MIQQGVLTNDASVTRALYDEYAGLLFGYIYEVVKDREMAEQYLISVFNEIPRHIHEIKQPGANIYRQLQVITRRVLSGYFENIPVCKTTDPENNYLPSRPSKFLSGMTEEQRLIFCSIHYHGKTISVLAAELQKPEDTIRKILQQAFTVIRRAA